MIPYNVSVEWARASRIRTFAKLESTSTNQDAKEQMAMLGSRSLVIAGHQTAGRGRGSNTWSDSPGQALLSSWIFMTEKSPQPVFSALVGLALFEAARATWPQLAWSLKAPNDLHVIDASGTAKKIAGLLIELVSAQGSGTAVIVGLGMNVTGAPSGTTPYAATSLQTELSVKGGSLTDADWGRFLSAWLEACEKRLLEGVQSELKQSSRAAIRDALAPHPEYRDITDVQADGSLAFKDGRTLRWTEL